MLCREDGGLGQLTGNFQPKSSGWPGEFSFEYKRSKDKQSIQKMVGGQKPGAGLEGRGEFSRP